MKRWVFRIVLFLLLGAIINIAVVWGIVLSHGSSKEIWASGSGSGAGERVLTSTEARWYRSHKRNIARILEQMSQTGSERQQPIADDLQRSFGWEYTEYWEVFQGPSGGDGGRIQMPDGRWVNTISTGQTTAGVGRQIRCGWPFKSMKLDQGILSNDGTWEIPVASGTNKYIVPIGIISSGFMLNTISFAVCLWGIFIGAVALRHYGRIKRGLCPKCAYPVGVSDTCTECGRPVKRSMLAQKAGAA